MKYLLIVFVLFYNTSNIFSIIPLIIDSEENIITKFRKDMSVKLPKGIDLLFYDIMVLNTDNKSAIKINNDFKKEILLNKSEYKYSIEFFSEIRDKDTTSDYSFADNYDEKELIGYGNYLKKDAVFIATITLMDKTKKIYNKETNKYYIKPVALLQGNIFNSDSNNSIFRFSYYMLLD